MMTNKFNWGFTLIELISVMILVGIISVVLLSRMSVVGVSAVQSSRDDVIAALFFAQQQAMMRSTITVVITTNSISVNENNVPIQVSTDYYPLGMPSGVSASPITLIYDKLGRTTATNITLTGSGNSSGASARIRVEASGYAFAN
ncbi:MAG TPA: type II secretion system protein [Cellvibrio sp.]|nr:type II secretion system protein [Cellvibrio sp.]